MGHVSKCCSSAGLFAIIVSSVTAGPVDYRAGDIFVVGTEGFNPVGQISRFDPSTGQRDIIARAGLLDNPTDVTFARNGDLLVSDLSGKVIRVDRKTGMQSIVASGGKLASANGIAVDSAGDVFVSDFLNATIFKLDDAGGLHPFATFDQENVPGRLSLSANGNLLVADQGPTGQVNGPTQGGLIEIDPKTGKTTRSIKGEPFFVPTAIAADADGLDAVTNLSGFDNSFFTISPSGKISTISLSVAPSFMSDVESDGHGDFIALDSAGARLLRIDPKLQGFSEIYSGPGWGDGMAIARFDSGQPAESVPLPAAVWSGLTGSAAILTLGAFRTRYRRFRASN